MHIERSHTSLLLLCSKNQYGGGVPIATALSLVQRVGGYGNGLRQPIRQEYSVYKSAMHKKSGLCNYNDVLFSRQGFRQGNSRFCSISSSISVSFSPKQHNITPASPLNLLAQGKQFENSLLEFSNCRVNFFWANLNNRRFQIPSTFLLERSRSLPSGCL